MANPRVLYSIAARLGASGIGHIAHQAALGIHRAEWLERLFVSSNAQSIIPGALIRQWGLLGRAVRYLAAHDATGLLYHAEGMLFDDWVAMGMPIGDLFHGWNGSCLRSLRLARRRSMVTVVERASSHPITQTRLLGEEYRRWGVPLIDMGAVRLPRLALQILALGIQLAERVLGPRQVGLGLAQLEFGLVLAGA